MSFFKEDGHTVDYLKWIHLDHCIDMIRQSLMCNADVTAVGFDWYDSMNYMRIHLNSVHRCKNWDAIHEWSWNHHASWNGHMVHVDEKTGKVVDHGEKPDMTKGATHYRPEGWNYTKDDM